MHVIDERFPRALDAARVHVDLDEARNHRPSRARCVEALAAVEGTYGLAVVHADFPDRIVVARNGSPLIIGVGDQEMHVASDLAALVRYTTTVAHLDDGELATITADGFTTYTAATCGQSRGRPTTLDVDPAAYDAGGARRPSCTRRCSSSPSRGRAGAARPARRAVRHRAPRRARTWTPARLRGDPPGQDPRLRLGVLRRPDGRRADRGAGPDPRRRRGRPSEFRYRNPVIEPDTLYVAVSQSGETIDTLLAVQEIRRKGGRVVGLVNVVGSRDRPRVRRRHLPARRPRGRGRLDQGADEHVRRLRAARPAARPGPRPVDRRRASGWSPGCSGCPAQIEEILEPRSEIAEVAGRLAEAESLFFIGRVRGYPVAREGAQKFKEISYRHAEAYQTSELKHGPLALIARAVPTVAIVPDDELTDRNVGALHEIAARRGPLVVVTHAGVDLGEVRRGTASTYPATSASSTRSC